MRFAARTHKPCIALFIILALLSPAAISTPIAPDCQEDYQRLTSNLLPVERVFINTNGEKIAYLTTGEGENIIIFLNGLGKSWKQWNPLRESLLASHSNDTVFVQLDLHGQGKTSQISWLENYLPSSHINFQKQIDTLDQLIESNGWQKKNIVLIGHSYGAGIAGRYIHSAPGKIKRAILLTPFVDNLETYQRGGIGAWMAAMKFGAETLGLKSHYDYQAILGSNLGMMLHWPYFFSLNDGTNLADVMAQNSGIRNIGMNKSLQQPGDTKIDLIIMSIDELIPFAAHKELWDQIPEANKGKFIILPTLVPARNSPELFPEEISRAINRK